MKPSGKEYFGPIHADYSIGIGRVSEYSKFTGRYIRAEGL